MQIEIFVFGYSTRYDNLSTECTYDSDLDEQREELGESRTEMSSQFDSEDSSDDDHISYLIATGMFPGMKANNLIRLRRGSIAGKRPNKARQFGEATKRLFEDYFSDQPKYSATDFERRFRMPRSVFDRIFDAVQGHSIFVQRRDRLGKRGIHPLQRVTAALRMLAYGVAADALDEYLQMSEDSVLLSMKEFCKIMVSRFQEEYLRAPTEADLRRIMSINAARGFSGCVGSIDCQHWEWQNCPLAWAGQYKGKEKKPTIVLEAICDGELWIWHAFFGSPGSRNGINILDHSPTIEKIIAGEFPPSLSYNLNGRERRLPYYLADGIYPDWAIFAKTVSEGATRKEKVYASAQEAFRKDIERPFGVLVARFHILQRPARLWYPQDIANVMKTCIIIHNMVVESRRDTYESGMGSLQFFNEAQQLFADGISFQWHTRSAAELVENGSLPDGVWAGMVDTRETRITSRNDHFSLKRDLVEHAWNRHSSE